VSSLESNVDALLPELLAAFGPSGRESGVRRALRKAVRGLGTLSEDATGNLRLHRPGRGPRLLLATPMDAAGVIVTRVDGSGLGRVTMLGGRAPVELVGSTVVFEDGKKALLGYDRGPGSKNGVDLEADQLFLETGLGKKGEREFPVGSVGAIEDRPERLGEFWCGANLEGRAGCAAVVAALRAARTSRYDLHVVFAAQSDVGARGATTGAFGIDPELAIVVDVAHLEGRETPGIALGKGPCLGLKESGYVAHPQALALLKKAAAAARVKTQWLIREHEGTDARAIRAARTGVPTALVAIPARKSGGALSLAHTRDITQTAALVAKLLAGAPAKGGSR